MKRNVKSAFVCLQSSIHSPDPTSPKWDCFTSTKQLKKREHFSIFCVCELNLEDLINIFGFKIHEKWSIVSKQVKWLCLAEWLDSRERWRIRFICIHPQSSICKIAFCNIFSPFSLFLNTMYYFSMSLAPKTKTIIRISKFNLFMPKYSVMLNMC